LLCGAPFDFVLASGGHNAGIVSEPGHANHSDGIRPAQLAANCYSSPDEWLGQSEAVDGSWWPLWKQWLLRRPDRQRIAPPVPEQVLGAAPGSFVVQR
jgi:polyhydroxyalkanoate synthase